MSKRKRLVPEIPSVNSQPAPYGGNDYRVRVMEVRLVVDVYDKSGSLLGRVRTPDELAIPESDFPVEMCRLIHSRIDLKHGFYCLKDDPTKSEPKP